MKKLYLLIFIITISITSCEKEIDINIKNSPPKIVINSKIFEDSTVSANIYRTSYINEYNHNLWYIDTAIVKLYNENILIEELTLDSLGKYSGKQRIKPNSNYTISASVRGFETATSQITTLYKVPFLSIDSLGASINVETQKTVYRFCIKFKDDGATNDYYMIDFSDNAVGTESTEIYSNDPAIEVGKDGYTYPDGITWYWNFYFSDELFNGNEYTFTFLVPQYKVDEGFNVNLSHITKAYFKYIQTYEAQNSKDGLEMFYQAIQVSNNIKNGMGVFGAISSYTKKYQPENSIK